ncbi:hypothetical protein HD554DRAFT_2042524 [Boletus coccyginus]|nr:hypothetical protein HD554DRAFT_2042524 [Boletus coccyginus]
MSSGGKASQGLSLTSTGRFLMSMDHRPDFARTTVKTLCLNVSIRLDMAASILALCTGVKCLNMHFPCHPIGENPILGPLNDLSHLNVLCVDLSSIFNTRTIYLPNVSIFHRITRLHLTNAWATWNPAGNSIGLEELKQLTHLSLHLSTVRMLPVLLRKILDRENLAVLVIWKRPVISYHATTRVLLGADLKDERVLVLDDELLRHHMLDDNLWTSAEHVIKQRRDTEVTPSDGNDDVIMPYIAKPADPGFHSEVGWMVKTDEDPDGSGEGSEAESAKGSSLCRVKHRRADHENISREPDKVSDTIRPSWIHIRIPHASLVQIVPRTKGSKLKSKSPSSLLEKVGYGCTRSSVSADSSNVRGLDEA